MGNRRMMSKTVTQTQRFLMLPIEAQALYFHMLQNTDDDGVCETFMVLKLIGVNPKLLENLEEANLVKKLNDELVYHLTDFKEQNTIDSRRYKKSRYNDLLDEQNELDEQDDFDDFDDFDEFDEFDEFD